MDAKTAVRKHEQNMHPGQKPTKLKAGGKTNADMLKYGRNMAKVFGLTYAGMLGGPAIIGWLASLSDLGTALWVGALLGALIALGSLLIKNNKES